MKKNYLFLAAATTLFAACVQTDVVTDIPEPQQQAISFETFANKQTRADEPPAASATNLETHHDAFSVWASKKLTESEYVDVYGGKSTLGTVTYDANATTEIKWKASPLKFWDKAALNYYFYAAAPTDANWVLNSTEGVSTNNTVGTNGKFTLTGFTLIGTNLVNGTQIEPVGTWDNIHGDKDLMVATPVTFNDINSYTKADPDPVSFTFRHILSKFNIKVKGIDLAAYSATIKLNALNVVGLNNVANYTESSETACDWSNWTDTNDPLTLVGGWSDPSLTLGTNYLYTHEYLVIPQTVDHDTWMNKGTAPTVPYIYIDYNITTTGTSTSTENFKSYYSLADIFGDTNLVFAEGGQYTLSVSIAPDVIEFETTETSWTDKHPQDGTPDINIE